MRSSALEQIGEELGISNYDLSLFKFLYTDNLTILKMIIWDDPVLVLHSVDLLIRAIEEDAVAIYDSLIEWRDSHSSPEVWTLVDSDLRRLASSLISADYDTFSNYDLMTLSHAIDPRFSRVLMDHSDEILELFGVETETEDLVAEESLVEDPVTAASAPAAMAPQQPQIPDPSKPFDFVQVTRFARYEWNHDEPRPVGKMTVTTVGDEVEMQWQPAPEDAPVTLYRIVQSYDNWPSGSPDLGPTIGTTCSTAGRIRILPASSVSFFAVWAYQGKDYFDASQSQPVLIATSELVWPPTDLRLSQTPSKEVAGTYRIVKGTQVEVQLFRKGEQPHYNQSRQVHQDSVQLTGFVDHNPPYGEVLVYAAFSIGKLPDGRSIVSEPATAEIEICPEAQQIKLEVKSSRSTRYAYDLSWLKPEYGEVLIYATPERPAQGLENEVRSREVLEGQGLIQEYEVIYPVTDAGGLCTIPAYRVEEKWVRTYFMAVHRINDEVMWMSQPVAVVVPRPPDWVKITERVDAQIVSFPWPQGVSIVQVYQSPKGVDLHPEDNDPIASLTREEYDKVGGIRITRTLPSKGCSLHVFGVVYSGGRAVHSRPSVVDYPGIARLRYEVVPMDENQQEVNPDQKKPAFYRIFATADDEIHDVPIEVVGRLNRLPLDPGDGKMVYENRISLSPEQRVVVCNIPAGNTQVMIRLFISASSAEAGSIAVLDPSVMDLEVSL